VRGLIDGGAISCWETIFDTLNARPASSRSRGVPETGVGCR
jgi:hypothetical protein